MPASHKHGMSAISTIKAALPGKAMASVVSVNVQNNICLHSRAKPSGAAPFIILVHREQKRKSSDGIIEQHSPQRKEEEDKEDPLTLINSHYNSNNVYSSENLIL